MKREVAGNMHSHDLTHMKRVRLKCGDGHIYFFRDLRKQCSFPRTNERGEIASISKITYTLLYARANLHMVATCRDMYKFIPSYVG
jgi:hypothetical protein